MMEAVKRHAASGGKLLGICNGFQILCEAHLLPGVLLRNINQSFICDHVFLRVETNQQLLTAGCQAGEVLRIPIAHADGRYFADEKTLDALERNHQVLLRYCDAQGNVHAAHNPNGAMNNIAGICNREGNVFGMMPHPERASEIELGNSDGRKLLEALCRSAVQTALAG
jgi:phosphoribosylformylglycinamidine synthase